ncbi:MAG: DnaD domain protein [Anaerovoracaceae bacterium]|nr:DnaD domain protein [Anaerovoracaceae bacterium]
MDLKAKKWGEDCFKDTHINNMFIKNYLAEAPGDYVKVYLYFMMQNQIGETADVGLASIDLNISEDVIMDGIIYWKDKEVLEVEIKDRRKKPLVADCPLEDRELVDMFAMIQRILGRPLGGAEPVEIVSWLTDYGATPEMIIYAFTYSSKNKHNPGIKYIHAIVKDWVDKGLFELEKIEEHLEKNDLQNQKHRRIFKALGWWRNPTEAERKMMEKWIEDWGVPLENILEACNKTTGISNPNLNYIDRVLSNQKEGIGKGLEGGPKGIQGINTVEGIYNRMREEARESALRRREEVYRKDDLIKALDEEISSLSIELTRTALASSPEKREAIRKILMRKREERAFRMTEAGYSPQYTEIQYTCKDCQDTGKTSQGTLCGCFQKIKDSL